MLALLMSLRFTCYFFSEEIYLEPWLLGLILIRNMVYFNGCAFDYLFVCLAFETIVNNQSVLIK